jgi:hypothetical protein
MVASSVVLKKIQCQSLGMIVCERLNALKSGKRAALTGNGPTTDVRRPAQQIIVAEAFDQVIVDHPSGLHEGVANGGADKTEATLFEVLAHGVGLG